MLKLSAFASRFKLKSNILQAYFIALVEEFFHRGRAFYSALLEKLRQSAAIG